MLVILLLSFLPFRASLLKRFHENHQKLPSKAWLYCLFWEFCQVILRTNFSYICLYPWTFFSTLTVTWSSIPTKISIVPPGSKFCCLNSIFRTLCARENGHVQSFFVKRSLLYFISRWSMGSGWTQNCCWRFNDLWVYLERQSELFTPVDGIYGLTAILIL